MRLSQVFISVFIACIFIQTSHALLECFKCVQSTDCANKDKDFCDGHDRCLKLEYKDPNGAKVQDARCSKETECDTEVGEMMLCEKKKDCKILQCCKDDLCNSPASWIRFDVRMITLVIASIAMLLWR